MTQYSYYQFKQYTNYWLDKNQRDISIIGTSHVIENCIFMDACGTTPRNVFNFFNDRLHF